MNRRFFISQAVPAAAGLALLTSSGSSLADDTDHLIKKSKENDKKDGKHKAKEPEVTANEDLMREHGILNRVLLVYEECQRRLSGKNFEPSALNKAAIIIRDFIEKYHEEIEEEHVFALLTTSGKHVKLCQDLKLQHDIGRKITSELITLSSSKPDDEALKKMDEGIARFIRMYRPHEAFEDTVVFPAFRELLSEKEYKQYGDKFEARERKQFGTDGFDKYQEKITEIEKSLGIYDIKQFTPKV